ncbi:MAG TPA: family 16 glycoside hydrolase, partial [Acidobacteriota bacterium]|nr:family 16 glycoside hydrolase [Acidobacteriota bacterium]
MKRMLLPILIFITAVAVGQISPQEKKEGFRPLFNGKNLDGWDGDPRLWKMVDGVVVGSTEGVSLDHNSFLISKKTYS